MNIFLFLFLIVAICGYWAIMRYKPADSSIFKRDNQYPVHEMHDGMTYYKMPTFLLALRSAFYGLTPAIFVGVASVTLMGDGIFWLYLIIGIVGMYFFDILVERISARNDGREMNTVVDNVFGRIPYLVVIFMEFLFKAFYIITVMYFMVVVTATILDINQFFVLGVVMSIWSLYLLFTSQMIARNIAYIGGAMFAIVTIIAFFTLWFNGHVDLLGESRSWAEMTSSLDDKALIFGAIIIGIVSPRSLLGVTEITRIAKNKKQSNIAVGTQRASQLLMVVIWTAVSAVAIQAAVGAGFDYTSLNIFARVEYVITFTFGEFKWVFAAMMMIASILALEIETGPSRKLISKYFRADSNHPKVILISTLSVAAIAFGFVLLIEVTYFENTFWSIFAIISLNLISFYSVLLAIYALKKRNVFEAIVPTVFIMLFAFASVPIFFNLLPINFSHWFIIIMSWAWAAFIIVLGLILLYLDNPHSEWENDIGKWKVKIGGLRR